MAVSSIRIASIIGMMSELDKVIKLCGKSQIFHPDDALSFYDNTENFVLVSDKNPYSAPLQILKEAILSSGKPLELVDIKKFNVNKDEIKEYVKYLTDKLGVLMDKQKELKQKIDYYQKDIENTKHFLGLSLDLKKLFSCKYIKVHFGSLPKDSYEKLSSYDDNPNVLFFPSSSDDLNYWGIYFAPVTVEKEINDIFSSLYFKEIDVSIVKENSLELHIANVTELIKENENLLRSVESKIESFWKVQYKQCIRFYSKLEELNTYFGIKQYVYRYNNSFILVGWIPDDKEAEFSNQLDKISGIEYSIEDSKEGLKFSPPVKLKNKRIFKPFEFFVDMYGLPCYDEVDPTPFVAVTYTLLFGIMFGDLGQGLLLAIIGGLLWKFKKMKLARIMVPCGISASIFGIVFGSVFGFEHVLDPFYQKVFGLSSKPIEVMEPEMTNDIIYAAVGIGIVLVIMAMLINVYSSLKRKNWGKGIFGPNGVAGLLFYGSFIFGAISSLIFNMHIVNVYYIIFLIIIPLISILFHEPLGKLVNRDPDWQPNSWGEYITQNSFELFEVILSYVTNTMSFLRVGAFVLVHAGMMLVVFTLAEMSGGIGYAIIVIIGNLFVMGLEALLVGIQVLRLDFYEMFSRFFDGQGRPFKPITANTTL